MDRPLTTIEIVGLAIRSEEDAAKFYGQISKMIENEIVRDKYETLAREEVGHRQQLIQLYKDLTANEENPPRIPGEPETAEIGDEVEGTETLEELLNIAIDREQKAAAYYEEAAANTRDVNALRILKYLAVTERSHELLLKGELEAYLLDRDWYTFSPEELQHVGP